MGILSCAHRHAKPVAYDQERRRDAGGRSRRPKVARPANEAARFPLGEVGVPHSSSRLPTKCDGRVTATFHQIAVPDLGQAWRVLEQSGATAYSRCSSKETLALY